MRNRERILRKISEQNLDPKVAYVAGKNGKLVEKKLPVKHTSSPEAKSSTGTVETVSEAEDAVPKDEASSEDPQLQDASKKKKPLFRKKNVTSE